MNDREILRAMFDRAGVVYDDEDEGELTVERLGGRKARWTAETTNLGYSGFFTVFTFNAEGALVSVGAWE